MLNNASDKSCEHHPRVPVQVNINNSCRQSIITTTDYNLKGECSSLSSTRATPPDTGDQSKPGIYNVNSHEAQDNNGGNCHQGASSSSSTVATSSPDNIDLAPYQPMSFDQMLNSIHVISGSGVGEHNSAPLLKPLREVDVQVNGQEMIRNHLVEDHNCDNNDTGPMAIDISDDDQEEVRQDTGLTHQIDSTEAIETRRVNESEQGQPRRHRTNYSPQQLARLEAAYQEERYVVPRNRAILSRELNLPENTIKVWFQNRRMKKKRHEMMLPAAARKDPHLRQTLDYVAQFYTAARDYSTNAQPSDNVYTSFFEQLRTAFQGQQTAPQINTPDIVEGVHQTAPHVNNDAANVQGQQKALRVNANSAVASASGGHQTTFRTDTVPAKAPVCLRQTNLLEYGFKRTNLRTITTSASAVPLDPSLLNIAKFLWQGYQLTGTDVGKSSLNTTN